MKLRYNPKDAKEFDRKPGAFLAEIMTDQNSTPKSRPIVTSTRSITPREVLRHNPLDNLYKPDLTHHQLFNEQVHFIQNYKQPFKPLTNDNFKSSEL